MLVEQQSPGGYTLSVTFFRKWNKHSRICNHDRAHIEIVVCCCRPVDDHRSSQAITVLREQMRVVPASAVRRGSKGVGPRRSWGDSTFRDAWNTVLVVGTNLADTVPMNGRCVVCQVVRNLDSDQVALGNISEKSAMTLIDFRLPNYTRSMDLVTGH